MKKYLFHHQFAYAPKNKLEKAVAEYLFHMNRFTVNEADFPRLQDSMREAIGSLNEQHPRCTPVKIYFWSHMTADLEVNVGGFVKSQFLQFEEV